MTSWSRSFALLFVLAASVASADVVRPPPKGTSPLAMPIDSVRGKSGDYPGATYYKSLPDDLRKKLDEDGEVLIGKEDNNAGAYGGYIKAIAIFKQPKKRVFELMTDTTKQVQYLPRLKTAVAAAHTPTSELTEFGLKVAFSTYHFRVQHWFYPEQSRIEWKLDDTFKNDIKAQEGYWQLFALTDDTTIAEYGTRVETGLAVPKFLQNIFARSDIPKALRAQRKYIDSNGTWRRDD